MYSIDTEWWTRFALSTLRKRESGLDVTRSALLPTFTRFSSLQQENRLRFSCSVKKLTLGIGGFDGLGVDQSWGLFAATIADSTERSSEGPWR